jgi:methylated-DNA-[protein]-cysteine S-methyltransferase
MLEFGYLATPIGGIGYAKGIHGIVRLTFMGDGSSDALHQALGVGDGTESIVQTSPELDCLSAYFAGDLTALDVLEVAPKGTLFQLASWSALRRVKAGELISYGGLAERVGRPQAARAMGGAMGANPVPLVIPCHRVVGASGTLTGFSCGLDLKRWLLAHEGFDGTQSSFSF